MVHLLHHLRAFFALFVLTAVASGCPGDEVPVGSDTTMTTSGTASTAPGTSGTSPSTSGMQTDTQPPVTTDPPGSSTTAELPDESSSSGSIFETTSTSGELTATGTTTGDIMMTSTTTDAMTTTGEVMDQDCPYGTLGAPDTVMDTTLNQDSEFTSSCGGGGAPDVSYTLTAPQDGTYVIDTFGSSIDTILSVRDGTCGGPLLVCNNDDPFGGPQSSVSVSLTEGQTVTVIADGFGVMGGPVQINVAVFEGICPNGDLGNAVPQTQSGSTVGVDNTFFGSCGGDDAGDDAYLFTAPSNGVYLIDTEGSDFDTVLYVRDGCGGVQLACDDNSGAGATSRVDVPLSVGEQIAIFVDGNGAEEGNYDINIDVDLCPDYDLGNTVPQTASGTTAGMLNTSSGSCGGGGATDEAYTFTAPADGVYVFDTDGSAYDTVLYAFDGATCNGAELACDDDDPAFGLQSRIAVNMTNGQEITLVVDGFGTNQGAYDLNVSAPVCGDTVIDFGEECEAGDLDGETCVSQGFAGGVLACSASCTFDLGGCTTCGDNVVDGTDTCDGSALDQQSCVSQGFTGGSLDCNADCGDFDTSECSDTVVAVCSTPDAAIDSAFPDTVDTINVADMGTIADVDVFIDITHTWAGDLEIVLSADDLGVTNALVTAACTTQDDVWAFFNDEGNGVADCVAPIGIEGNLTPQAPFSAYDTMQAAGDWTLTVTDLAASDEGTLNEWCVFITLEP